VVLDDSSSMRQRSGTTTLFDRALDRIRTLADDLSTRRDGDLFSIVRNSRSETPDVWSQRVGPELGRRIGNQLKEFVCGDGSPDFGKSLQAAVQRAAQVQEAARTEFYVVSDQRAQDWGTDDDKPRPAVQAALASMRPDVDHLTVLGVGGQHTNLAVVDVRLVDRIAIAGVPVALAVDVQNFGLDASQPTAIAIEIQGKSRVVRPVPQLAPGERQALPIAHTFHQPGPHRIEVQLEATDHYLLDDRRTLALEVRDRSRILLVDGQPDEDDGEVFFLQNAYDHTGEAISGIETQVVTELDLPETDLAPFDMIWLANLPAPSQATAERLLQFVAGGGGLVVSVGAQVDPTRYNELFWLDGKGILPLPLGETAGDPDRPEHAVLVGRDHEFCRPLGEILELLTANVLLVQRWLGIAEPARHEAAIIARIRDTEGPPLLVTRTIGTGGGVALWAITADKFWSNMPSTDLLLVFAHQLHKNLSRRQDTSGANLQPNGLLRLQLDPGVYRPDVIVRGIGGEGDEQTFTATAAAEAEAQTLQLAVPMQDLRQLSAYEIEVTKHDGTLEPRLIARNPVLAESRLLPFPDTAFSRLYPPELHNRITFLGEGAGTGAASGAGEVWRWLAALLLAGLLLESLLAWRFGRR
jgi:hypothetical protein